MPAVDYRLPDGLEWEELNTVLKALVATGQVAGITVTIFNPHLDTDDSIARRFTRSLIEGLS